MYELYDTADAHVTRTQVNCVTDKLGRRIEGFGAKARRIVAAVLLTRAGALQGSESQGERRRPRLDFVERGNHVRHPEVRSTRSTLNPPHFAYGSNLDGAQMRGRCANARLVGAAIMDGYRLGFAGPSAAWGGGMATVVRDREVRVPGLVWALVAKDLDRLDRFEEHPDVYARRRPVFALDHGARRRAHVDVKEAAEATPPTEAYFGVLWRAYQEHGFDELGLALALGGER